MHSAADRFLRCPYHAKVMNTLDATSSKTASSGAGSVVKVDMASLSEAPQGDLRVLHADAHLLVLDKPAGLLCVPGRGDDKQDCLARRAQQLYPDALVVHRLDMATSGLWVMARGAAAQRRLSHAFATRAVRKRYVAVVAGLPVDAQAADTSWRSIDLPLIVDWPQRPRSKVDPVHGKPSLTRWRLMSSDGRHARLELEPHTGRSHQLRVHLQAIGCPIVGDTLYASADVAASAGRLLLHASAITVPHPASDMPMHFESPPPF